MNSYDKINEVYRQSILEGKEGTVLEVVKHEDHMKKWGAKLTKDDQIAGNAQELVAKAGTMMDKISNKGFYLDTKDHRKDSVKLCKDAIKKIMEFRTSIKKSR